MSVSQWFFYLTLLLLKAVPCWKSWTKNFTPYWLGWHGSQCPANDHHPFTGKSHILFLPFLLHNFFWMTKASFLLSLFLTRTTSLLWTTWALAQCLPLWLCLRWVQDQSHGSLLLSSSPKDHGLPLWPLQDFPTGRRTSLWASVSQNYRLLSNVIVILDIKTPKYVGGKKEVILYIRSRATPLHLKFEKKKEFEVDFYSLFGASSCELVKADSELFPDPAIELDITFQLLVHCQTENGSSLFSSHCWSCFQLSD